MCPLKLLVQIAQKKLFMNVVTEHNIGNKLRNCAIRSLKMPKAGH